MLHKGQRHYPKTTKRVHQLRLHHRGRGHQLHHHGHDRQLRHRGRDRQLRHRDRGRQLHRRGRDHQLRRHGHGRRLLLHHRDHGCVLSLPCLQRILRFSHRRLEYQLDLGQFGLLCLKLPKCLQPKHQIRRQRKLPYQHCQWLRCLGCWLDSCERPHQSLEDT